MPPTFERAFPAGPTAVGRGLVASSFQYYLSGDEHLRVLAHSISTPWSVDITGRFWREADRSIQVFRHRLTADFVTNELEAMFRLDAGALLNLRLGHEAAQHQYPAIFARAEIVQGFEPGAVVPIGTLLQGYLGARSELGWPGSPIQGMSDGPGHIAAFDWQIFGAPARAQFLIPQFRRARFMTGLINMVTSAVAATRVVFVRVVDPGSNLVWQGTGGIAQLASTTIGYSVGPGLSPSGINAGGVAHLPLPSDLDLSGGSAVEIRVDNIQAGDAVNNFGLLSRLWVDGV